MAKKAYSGDKIEILVTDQERRIKKGDILTVDSRMSDMGGVSDEEDTVLMTTSDVVISDDEYIVASKKVTVDKGEISDGYHTFNELYFHRMVLFAVICNTYKTLAWKSWKHHEGDMYPDYFIVGIDTPQGSYSYHYHKDYWFWFDVGEIEFAPKWDGHKPEDIDRLLSLIQK